MGKNQAGNNKQFRILKIVGLTFLGMVLLGVGFYYAGFFVKSGMVYQGYRSPGKTVCSVLPEARPGVVGVGGPWETGGIECTTFAYQLGGVAEVAFLPDSRRLISNAENLKLWRDDGRLLRTWTNSWWGLELVDGVQALAVSPNGKLMITGYYDGVFKVTPVVDGTTKRFKTAVGDVGVVALAVNPDSKLFAAGLDNRTIEIREVDGHLRRTMIGFADGIDSLGFTPGGQALVVGLNNGDIQMRKLDGHLLWTERSPGLAAQTVVKNVVAGSPNGRLLVSGVRINVASNSKMARLWLWDSEGRLLQTLDTSGRDVCSVAFASGSRIFAVGLDDGTIQLWSSAGRLLRTLSGGYRGKVNAVAFAPDGRTLASTGACTVKLWRVRND